jgi:superfamily II DNA or RNA helicase
MKQTDIPTLAKRCQHAFDAAVREQGDAYFVARRVQRLDIVSNLAEAEVLGSAGHIYDVAVDFDPGVTDCASVACHCPQFRNGSACKHIWATMRQLDAEGWGATFHGKQKLAIVLTDEEGSLRNGAMTKSAALTVDSFGHLLRKSQVTESPTTKVASGLTWRQQLANVVDYAKSSASLRHESEVTKDRQIWYVINLPSCRERGVLAIDLFQRQRKRNGEFGKLKRLSVPRSEFEQAGESEDKTLLQLLLGHQTQGPVGPAQPYHYYNSSYATYSQATVAPVLYPFVLDRLAATKRFVYQEQASAVIDIETPLQWDAGEAWHLQVVIESDEEYKRWRIRGRLLRGTEYRPVNEPLLILRHGLIVFRDRLARFCDDGNFAWLAILRRHPSVDVPYRERKAFLEQLATLPEAHLVELPANMGVREIVVPPKGLLQVLVPTGRQHDRAVLARVLYEYGTVRIPCSDDRAMHFEPIQSDIVRRDPTAEAALLQVLLDHGARWLQPGNTMANRAADIDLTAVDFSAFVEQALQAGWTVEAEGQPLRRSGAVHLHVQSQVDWFELNGVVEFDGASTALPTLLSALRRGDRFITLDDGSRGLLPSQWLDQYTMLAELGQASDQGLAFKPSQALLLDALLADQDNVELDTKFSEYRDRLHNATLGSGTAPPGFNGVLRHYQEVGLGWLQYLQDCGFGGCLADDMGLGKTVQVLALLEARRLAQAGMSRPPSLVVVPKSLVYNWLAEAERFTPGLQAMNYTGRDREALRAEFADYHLIVTTYATMRSDIVALQGQRFDYVILDESQAIKNADSQAAKAVRLLHSDHRLAMTGTPIENHMGELWSLFEFLNPGLLGQRLPARVMTGAGDSGASAVAVLARGLQPFVLRRTKAQVLPELPAKTEHTLYCDLSPTERKYYDELREHYQHELLRQIDKQGLERSKIHVLEALLRLRQAACHPGLLLTSKAHLLSSKLELLMEQLAEILQEGHKALVFSQFTSFLGILRQHLDAGGMTYEYLDGRTRDREARVTRFQTDPDCGLFLISLKAGGTGLNLTAADYVYILDPWWNPAVEAQAVDRAYRIGQTRPVFAYRIIARGTIEEKIVALQKSKQGLADAIVSADNSIIRRLTIEDLELLLG